MAETLVELVAKIKADATGLKGGLSDAEKQTEASSQKMQDSLKKVGIAMAASGAAIIAALGLMGKAAVNEEINIKHLQVALKGVGVDYDNVKDSLEAVISATQRKTGIADNEQRDTLARLILVTKDYDKALNLLPLALDLAAFSQMNTSSAATYLAKAYEELEAGADKIGIRMGTTTIYFRDLNEVQKMVGGTAEAMQNPFSVLTAAMGDLSEAIGSFLIPIIKEGVGKIVDIAEKVQAWAKENPELSRQIVILSLAIGGFLALAGTLIMFAPAIAAAWATAMGPIGLITLIVAGLIAGGILLWQNWDRIGKFFSDMWVSMKEIALKAIDSILAGLQKFIGWIPGLGEKVGELREKIATMIEADKIAKEAKAAREAAAAELDLLTKATKDELDKQKSAKLKTLYKEKEATENYYKSTIAQLKQSFGEEKEIEKTKIELAKETRDARIKFLNDTIEKVKSDHEEAIRLINEQYGIAQSNERNLRDMAIETFKVKKQALDDELSKARELYDDNIKFLKDSFGVSQSTHRNKMDMARDATQAAKQALDRELEYTRDAHSEKMSLLVQEYNQKIKTVNAGANTAISAIQKEIDALNAEADADAQRIKIRDQNIKAADLIMRLSQAKSAEDRARIEEELNKLYEQMELDRLATERNARIKFLQDKISTTKSAADAAIEMLKWEMEVDKAVAQNKYEILQKQIADKKGALDKSLEVTLSNIEVERVAAEAMEKAKYDAAKTNIENRQKELKASTDTTLSQIENERIKAIKSETDKYDTTIKYLNLEQLKATEVYDSNIKQIASELKEVLAAEKQKHDAKMKTISAGIISLSPSSSTPAAKMPGLASGGIVTRPTMALVGEAGPEAVIPLSSGGVGGITINFTQPVFFDREDTMNAFVDKIKAGINRADRLRFGGAYSG